MGDRVSISFRFGNHESVALFSHHGGMGFVHRAQDYALKLQEEAALEGPSQPLYRLDPGSVMVDFMNSMLGHYVSSGRVKGNFYVGDMNDPMWGDNSDNGHHVIELQPQPATSGPEQPTRRIRSPF